MEGCSLAPNTLENDFMDIKQGYRVSQPLDVSAGVV